MKKLSASLDFVISGRKNILYSLILDKIKDNQDLKILDIGCKEGQDLFYLINKRPKIQAYGLDITFVESWINNNLENLYFINGDATVCPFKDESMDIVISAECIEHILDIEKFLANVYRILKPGGYFFITTPSRYSYTYLIGKLIPKRLKNALRKLVYFGISPKDGIKKILPNGKIIKEHVHEYSIGEFKKLLNKHDLDVEIIKAGYLYVPLAPLFDRFPLLINLWKLFDKTISKLPFTNHLKAHFIARAKKHSLSEIKNILIINLGGIGDILLSQPALRALKNKFSNCQISILVVPRVYDLVKDFSYIDSIFIFYKSISPLNLFRNFITLFILRRMHFALAINMRTMVSKRSTFFIKLLLYIINPKIKVGRNTDGRGNFFDISIFEPTLGNKYEREYDIDTVKALGVEVLDKYIDFIIDEKIINKVKQILEKEGVYKDTILIGIQPGGMPARRWPIENFAKVISLISEKINCKFIIAGAKEEAGLIKKLIKISQRDLINLAGELNLKELAALIKRCNLFISNDTGPMHIAAILKVPLIAIFGPGDLRRYDPRNISDKAAVLYKKVDCSPCNRIKCKSKICLKMITPSEVLEAALKFLKQEKVYEDYGKY